MRACLLLLALASTSLADEQAAGTPAPEQVFVPILERFTSDTVEETPDFRRHVIPLLGRLGCNGRACHGSFQGQGGFRLSLFGYDFEADHAALVDGDAPRANIKEPDASLLLQKPTAQVDHGGELRFELGSWQHRVLKRWIEKGAEGLSEKDEDLVLSHLEVTKPELVFSAKDETAQLRVVAHWSDGTAEDVTCLARFQSRDDSVATITPEGLVRATGQGDTHVVVFYDNGVASVPVVLPYDAALAADYPTVPTPTRIDELIVAKLRTLGSVPSDITSDVEFLRRVRLDLTGTLPTTEEIRAFVEDVEPDKRERKVDELLVTPEYSAWWATRLSDFTGNSTKMLNQVGLNGQATSHEWYEWLRRRVADNMPYHEIVARMVASDSREPGQSFAEFCADMSSYYHPESETEFADRSTMPHFWARRNVRQPEEKLLAFSYAFLGVRIECAQCHKHPFDQWTKEDFEGFKKFFTRINYGLAPDAREPTREMTQELGLAEIKVNQQRRELPRLLEQGKVVPWREVYLARNELVTDGKKKPKDKEKKPARRPQRVKAQLLAGDTIEFGPNDDPRKFLIDWMRSEPRKYMARAFVNRVWASYFGRGIVEPPDDLNLANPPSNGPLLGYLTEQFIAHNYDMRWLHREILTSRTYQLSWRPTESNQLDRKNFSHALPRRLPAEVAYDAIVWSTANDAELARMEAESVGRAIRVADMGAERRDANAASFALKVFGQPARETTCDCERSSDASLLQVVYLRNDAQTQSLLDRPKGWLQSDAARSGAEDDFIVEAYLRTLSRWPTPEETARSREHLAAAANGVEGRRDLLWALVNTKEFITNH